LETGSHLTHRQPSSRLSTGRYRHIDALALIDAARECLDFSFNRVETLMNARAALAGLPC
jgi:hypothetical protein